MHHKTADAPTTAGRVIHQARWYDLFGSVISFGRDKAIRATLVELAAPAPGEQVLDVGCGTDRLVPPQGDDAAEEVVPARRVKDATRRLRGVGGLVVHIRASSRKRRQPNRRKSRKDERACDTTDCGPVLLTAAALDNSRPA